MAPGVADTGKGGGGASEAMSPAVPLAAPALHHQVDSGGPAAATTPPRPSVPLLKLPSSTWARVRASSEAGGAPALHLIVTPRSSRAATAPGTTTAAPGSSRGTGSGPGLLTVLEEALDRQEAKRRVVRGRVLRQEDGDGGTAARALVDAAAAGKASSCTTPAAADAAQQRTPGTGRSVMDRDGDLLFGDGFDGTGDEEDDSGGRWGLLSLGGGGSGLGSSRDGPAAGEEAELLRLLEGKGPPSARYFSAPSRRGLRVGAEDAGEGARRRRELRGELQAWADDVLATGRARSSAGGGSNEDSAFYGSSPSAGAHSADWTPQQPASGGWLKQPASSGWLQQRQRAVSSAESTPTNSDAEGHGFGLGQQDYWRRPETGRRDHSATCHRHVCRRHREKQQATAAQDAAAGMQGSGGKGTGGARGSKSGGSGIGAALRAAWKDLVEEEVGRRLKQALAAWEANRQDELQLLRRVEAERAALEARLQQARQELVEPAAPAGLQEQGSAHQLPATEGSRQQDPLGSSREALVAGTDARGAAQPPASVGGAGSSGGERGEPPTASSHHTGTTGDGPAPEPTPAYPAVEVPETVGSIGGAARQQRAATGPTPRGTAGLQAPGKAARTAASGRDAAGTPSRKASGQGTQRRPASGRGQQGRAAATERSQKGEDEAVLRQRVQHAEAVMAALREDLAVMAARNAELEAQAQDAASAVEAPVAGAGAEGETQEGRLSLTAGAPGGRLSLAGGGQEAASAVVETAAAEAQTPESWLQHLEEERRQQDQQQQQQHVLQLQVAEAQAAALAAQQERERAVATLAQQQEQLAKQQAATGPAVRLEIRLAPSSTCGDSSGACKHVVQCAELAAQVASLRAQLSRAAAVLGPDSGGVCSGSGGTLIRQPLQWPSGTRGTSSVRRSLPMVHVDLALLADGGGLSSEGEAAAAATASASHRRDSSVRGPHSCWPVSVRPPSPPTARSPRRVAVALEDKRARAVAARRLLQSVLREALQSTRLVPPEAAASAQSPSSILPRDRARGLGGGGNDAVGRTEDRGPHAAAGPQQRAAANAPVWDWQWLEAAMQRVPGAQNCSWSPQRLFPGPGSARPGHPSGGGASSAGGRKVGAPQAAALVPRLDLTTIARFH